MAPGPIGATPSRPGRRASEFWPTQLRLFRDCPERYYRRHIARERMTAAFSRPLQRGSAVHKTLAAIFNARRDEEPDPSVRPLAERFLPRLLYEKAAQLDDWPDDLALVERLVERALAQITPRAAVVQVEETVDYLLGTRTRAPGALLVGKIDLLLKHEGAFLEHIEFKTGTTGSDPYQDVICRIGVVDRYGKTGLPVLSTTLHLSTGEEQTVDGDRALLAEVLPEIIETVRAIWDAETWPARENPTCRFCEYRATLCSLHGEWRAPERRSNGPR